MTRFSIRKHVQDLGRDATERKLKGLPPDLRVLRVDPAETIAVSQGGYTIGSPEVRGARYLVTEGLSTCMGIIGYNSDDRVGLLAHTGTPPETYDALTKVQYEIRGRLTTVGGSDSNDDHIAMVEGYRLFGDGTRLPIVGQNTLKDSAPRAIGLDTQTGEVFKPANMPELRGRIDAELEYLNVVSSALTPPDDVSVRYQGDRVAPLMTFLDRVKRK